MARDLLRLCLMTSATTIPALPRAWASIGCGSDLKVLTAIPAFGHTLIEATSALVAAILFSASEAAKPKQAR